MPSQTGLGATPDEALRIRARDPETLQRVVRDSLPFLLRAARAGGLSPDQADDAVQETFLTFVRRAEEFDGRAKVRSWLYGILANKVAKIFDAMRRHDATEDIDEVVETRFGTDGRWLRPPRGPDAGGDRERFRAWLEECLDRLPPQRRLAFVLREVEDLSNPEICEILGVTANNLGVLFYRARNGLRECLEERGLVSVADADL